MSVLLFFDATTLKEVVAKKEEACTVATICAEAENQAAPTERLIAAVLYEIHSGLWQTGIITGWAGSCTEARLEQQLKSSLSQRPVPALRMGGVC